MKIKFIVLLLGVSPILDAQLPLIRPTNKNAKEIIVPNVNKSIQNTTGCGFDINNFIGPYNFVDVDDATQNSVVYIYQDPDVKNGLIIKWLWEPCCNSDSSTAVPFKIRLDTSDMQTIYWDEQPIMSKTYFYGLGTAKAGTGTYDPCTHTLDMVFDICVDQGCYGPIFHAVLTPVHDIGAPEDYYWVGGSGDWNDYPDHWATTSGGTTFHTSVPDENDNVYFDNASFNSAEKAVVKGNSEVCGNFNFSSGQSVNFSASDLKVSNDFKINENFIPEIGNLTLMNDSIAEFKTFNHQFSNINFSGMGTVNVIDSLKADNLTISGSVKFPASVKCYSLTVENSDTSKLDISNSHVFVNEFNNNAAPGNFISDNSSVNIKYSLEGKQQTYNNIIVNSSSVNVATSLNVDSLLLGPQSGLLFTGFNITIGLNYLEANGTPDNYINIRGFDPVNFNKTSDSVTISYVILDRINATGGAVFYAPDCILKNGSSGWIGAKQYQEISFTSIANMPLTQDSVLIEATASSGLPVSMDLIEGNGTLKDNVFRPSGKGSVKIELTQEGGINNTINYAPAEKKSLSFEVYDPNDNFAIYNFKEASLVIGQESFDTTIMAADSLHFYGAYGCAVSSQGMFAASTRDADGGGRLMLWRSVPTHNGQPADIVLGRSGFSLRGSGTSASLMSWTLGVCFSNDGNKILASDKRRILIWNSIPTESGTPADVVIGADNFNDDGSGNSGWSANRFKMIEDLLITPDNKLIVADSNRILIFNKIPETNNASADVVIFQPDFTADESGISNRRISSYIRQVAVSGDGKLFVAIPNEARVLVFNKVPTVNDTPADFVLGSDDMFSIRPFDNNNLNKVLGSNGIAVSYDNIVAISGESYSIEYSRVLLYKNLPDVSGQLPDYVLGQPDLFSALNQGNSKRAIHWVQGLTFDKNGHLFVCEYMSPRILVFNLKNDTYSNDTTVSNDTTYSNFDPVKENRKFIISPNPTNGSFTIKHSPNLTIDEISIYDLQGKLIYNAHVSDSTGKLFLDPNLRQGFYLIKIQNRDNSVIQKLIVE